MTKKRLKETNNPDLDAKPLEKHASPTLTVVAIAVLLGQVVPKHRYESKFNKKSKFYV